MYRDVDPTAPSVKSVYSFSFAQKGKALEWGGKERKIEKKKLQ